MSKTKEAVQAAAPQAPALLDPFIALFDVVTGNIFDGPKAVVEAVTEGTKANGRAENSEHAAGQSGGANPVTTVNVTLDGIFRKPKPAVAGKPKSKPAAAAPTEAPGASAGESDEE